MCALEDNSKDKEAVEFIDASLHLFCKDSASGPPSRHVTLLNMYRPRGVLLEILGGGVPPGSSNPDPISDQKM